MIGFEAVAPFAAAPAKKVPKSTSNLSFPVWARVGQVWLPSFETAVGRSVGRWLMRFAPSSSNTGIYLHNFQRLFEPALWMSILSLLSLLVFDRKFVLENWGNNNIS